MKNVPKSYSVSCVNKCLQVTTVMRNCGALAEEKLMERVFLEGSACLNHVLVIRL